MLIPSRSLEQFPVLGFPSLGRLSGSSLEYTADHPCALYHASDQASGVVVLDSEHVVQGDRTQDVEPHVCPSDSKVPPALAVVFRFVSMCGR